MYPVSPFRSQIICPSRVQHQQITVQVPHKWEFQHLKISIPSLCKEGIHLYILNLRPFWHLQKTIDAIFRDLATFRALIIMCLSHEILFLWMTHITWETSERPVTALTMIDKITVYLFPPNLEVASLDKRRLIHSKSKLYNINKKMLWIYADPQRHILWVKIKIIRDLSTKAPHPTPWRIIWANKINSVNSRTQPKRRPIRCHPTAQVAVAKVQVPQSYSQPRKSQNSWLIVATQLQKKVVLEAPLIKKKRKCLA